MKKWITIIGVITHVHYIIVCTEFDYWELERAVNMNGSRGPFYGNTLKTSLIKSPCTVTPFLGVNRIILGLINGGSLENLNQPLVAQPNIW